MVQEDGRKGLRGLDTWWDRRGEGYGGALGGAEENVGEDGTGMSTYYRFWPNINSPSSGIAYDL